MKNTTFRKKALLSSVAMLLVALVALGSATFAWFSSNREVTADSMVVKAAAAQGLQISIDNGTTWANTKSFTSTTLSNPAVLSPVSLAIGTSVPTNGFYPAEVEKQGGDIWATGKDFGEWTAVAVPTPATGAVEAFKENDYFAVYEVQIKSSGDEIKKVSGHISYEEGSTTVNANEYIRMALVDAEGTVLATYGNEANNTTMAVDAVSTDKKTPSTTAIETKSFTVATATDPALHTFADANLVAPKSTEEGTKIRLIVWFEGQDAQCLDANQQAIGKIKLTFNY